MARRIPILIASIVMLCVLTLQGSFESKGASALAGNTMQEPSGQTATGTLPSIRPAPPKLPSVVLYDQYDHISSINATNSQKYEPSMATYDDFLADDFVVPAGQTWTLNEVDVAGRLVGNGPIHGFNVSIHADAGLPGAEIYTALALGFTNPAANEYDIMLATPAVLGPGTYWVMVQANLCWFCNEGQWNWINRGMQSNYVAGWYNPGEGWGTACSDAWGVRWGCMGDLPNPDQVFRLVGIAILPTATPTNTPTNIPTFTRTPTSTPTPPALLIGHVDWQGHGVQPDVAQIQPLTLTLKSGLTQVDFPGYQVTDPFGFFTVSVGALPQGLYGWRVRGPDYLATGGTVTLSGGTTQVEMGLQKVGDLTGDNACSISDFNLMKVNFGQGGPPPVGAFERSKDVSRPQAPISLILDDGSTDYSFGLNNAYGSFPVIAINRFTPNPSDFPMTLNRISIQFPGPAMSNRNLTGLNIDLLVYEDPDGVGDPSNATKIYQQTVQVQVADGVTFSDYPVSIPLDGPGDVYIGFANTYDHGGGWPISYPHPIDQSMSQHRSWVACNVSGADPDYNDLANNLMLTLIDNVGFSYAGNWVIRADANLPPTITPTRTPTITRTPTYTPTSTAIPQALLVGHVDWQGHGGQPDPMQAQPFTLTLKSSLTELNYPSFLATDPSGFFTVSVSVLPPGAYQWRAKGPSHLASSGVVMLTGAPLTPVEMGSQGAGDINGDNTVSIQDFNNLKSNFGTAGAPPMGPYKP